MNKRWTALDTTSEKLKKLRTSFQTVPHLLKTNTAHAKELQTHKSQREPAVQDDKATAES